VGAAGISHRLGTFPGGLTATTGSIVLTGHSPHLKLKLTVKGLPGAGSGHYEVWLFTSVVDSRRLGPISAGTHTVTFPLPSGARHYHWIDVTLQPKGSRSYSGESELRARNPVDGRRSVLHAKAHRHHSSAGKTSRAARKRTAHHS
jgi:hypothetical protein